jgi:hypothetical protein
MRFAVMLLCLARVFSQTGPAPPCGPPGTEPFPSYPSVDNPASVKSWSESETGRDWRPAPCSGWTANGFTSLITVVARFRYAGETATLVRRIGAISETAGIRYWSTTHQQWRTLITEASALSGWPQSQPRRDFTDDEIKQGADLYFQQTDNISGQAVYRMHFAEISPDRVVFGVENASAIRFFRITTFPPGELQSVYFLDRESKDVWRYYGMVRSGRHASWLAAGHQSSTINRAVALYRHLAGIPTDRDPPAAR